MSKILYNVVTSVLAIAFLLDKIDINEIHSTFEILALSLFLYGCGIYIWQVIILGIEILPYNDDITK